MSVSITHNFKVQTSRHVTLYLRRCMTFVFLYIMSTATHAVSNTDAAANKNYYNIWAAIAAFGLNIPYTVHLLNHKHPIQDLKKRFSYKESVPETLWNHSLNITSLLALSTEVPTTSLLLTGAVLMGLQTSAYTFWETYGVSIIWSGFTGMLLHRLFIQKKIKLHSLLALLLNSVTFAYYVFKAPPITTVAHLGGVIAGISLSFWIPYKNP